MNAIKINKLIPTFVLMVGFMLPPTLGGQAFPTPAAPQTNGSQIWLASYDGPDNQADTGNAVAIDGAGNTYVAGTTDGYNSSDKNIVVIKYGLSGQALWTKIYDGPGRSDGYNVDEAVKIAVDDQGYVYVVGNSASELHMDIVILRYKPDGTLDWERRYNGPATEPFNQSADAEEMIVTGDSVYVGGGGYDDNGPIVVLLRYSKTGDFQWEGDYSAQGPTNLAISADGSIYQTGEVYSQLVGENHFALIKYQANGTHTWDKIYRPTDPLPNDAAGLQVDTQGNVLVGGTVERTANFGTADDAMLLKYDPDGNIILKRQIADPNQQGSFSVLGFSMDNAGSSYLFTNGLYIIKFDSSGNQAWMFHSDELTAPGNNKVVMKSGPDQSLYVIAANGIMKFGPAGNVLLSYQYKTDPSDGLNPTDFALGGDASIAITGWYNNSNPYSIDMLTIKYPMNPGLFLTVEDALTSEGNRPDDSRTADFVVRLSKSLTYSVSFKYQTVDLSAKAGSDYVKTEGLGWIDPGQPWTVISVPILPDTTSEANKQFQLKILTSDGVTIVNDSAYATILDDDFDLVTWAKSIPTPGSDSSDLFDLKTDSQGNGYIQFLGGVSSFDPAGNQRWIKTFPGDTHAMQLDSQDKVYVTGMDKSNRLVVRKLDAAGNLLWEQFYSDASKGDHRGLSIAIDRQGDVLVGGVVPHKDPLYDTILLKYSAQGDLLWARQIHTEGAEITFPHSIFSDSAGNITLAGGANNPGSIVIMAKYSPNGDLIWTSTYQYNNFPWSNIVQAQYDQHGNLYLGVDSMSSSDMRAILLKFNANGEKVWEEQCGFIGCREGQTIKSLVMDPFGDLVVTIIDGSNAWVVKFRDQNNVWMWQLPMYSVPGQAAWDSEGFKYVTGGQQMEGLGYAYIYMIFTPSGTPLYERTETGQGAPTLGTAPYLAVNKDRSAYAMAGSTGYANAVKYAPLPLQAEVYIYDAMVKESDNAQEEMTFSVGLSKALDHDISLDFHTVDGTATAGQDYSPTQGKLTIPANSLSASIQIPILSDSLTESSEFFYVTLSGLPDGITYARSIASGKILDSSSIQVSLPLILQN